MKKGLSVLLIAAALFGFYGGATSLNDVLASKEYWEEEGERSTADMNKLEDGLNQLKDNEQAYIDGQQQLADGEAALADAEQQLADGEVELANGKAELAKGYADYAAAPAKLADAEKKLADGKAKLEDAEDQLAAGKKKLTAAKAQLDAAPGKLKDAEKQIAKGEEDLEEGAKSLKSLDTAISGVNQLINGYNNTWRPGYEALKDGRNKLFNGTKSLKDQMLQLAAFLPESARAGYVTAVNDVAGDDEKQAAQDYLDFISGTNTLAADIPVIQSTVAANLAGAKKMQGALAGASNNLIFAGTVADDAVYPNLLAMAALITDSTKKAQFEGAVKATKSKYVGYAGDIENNIKTETANYLVSPEGQLAVADELQKEGIVDPTKATDEQKQHAAEIVGAAYAKSIKDTETAKVAVIAEGDAALSQYRGGINSALGEIVKTLEGVDAIVNGDKVNKELLPGLKQFNAQATPDAVNKLSAGQDEIANGINTIASGVLANSTLKEGVEKEMGKDAIALLQVYSKSPNPANTKLANFASFETQMDKTPGLEPMLQKARQFLGKTKADGIKTYNEGKAKLDAGKKEYAQGKKDYAQGKKDYAKGQKDYSAGLAEYLAGKKTYNSGLAEYAQGKKDFAAAPGKLADGERKLAEGEAKLADGYKQYEDGKQALADGRAKLAEYEDGEQQVRDGLATLMHTEANGGLKSILDRRNGDDQFDDENGHLGLDEGLEAVEVGRGYQADSGVLITKEITNRAIGTAAGLGAGVLAVLAAILSFLKKNKGAAISAALAAVAGGIGAGVGFSAGEEFSDIAGSTVGTMPFVAAAVLAAVAAVFAIVHFTAKPEAK